MITFKGEGIYEENNSACTKWFAQFNTFTG